MGFSIVTRKGIWGAVCCYYSYHTESPSGRICEDAAFKCHLSTTLCRFDPSSCQRTTHGTLSSISLWASKVWSTRVRFLGSLLLPLSGDPNLISSTVFTRISFEVCLLHGTTSRRIPFVVKTDRITMVILFSHFGRAYQQIVFGLGHPTIFFN